MNCGEYYCVIARFCPLLCDHFQSARSFLLALPHEADDAVFVEHLDDAVNEIFKAMGNLVAFVL